VGNANGTWRLEVPRVKSWTKTEPDKEKEDGAARLGGVVKLKLSVF